MKDEFSSVVTDNQSSITESSQYVEVASVQEVQQVSELPSYEQQEETKTKKTTKADTSLMSRLSAFFVTIVAAVTIIIPTATSVNLTIEFADAIVTDTTISYGVSVTGETEEDLYVVVSNDFTERKVKLVDNHLEKTEENLKPNVKYKISVILDGTLSDTVLAEMEVKTLSVEDYRHSRFIDCTTECKCHIDGYFYFQMDFVDNIGSFSEFEATLTDSSNVSSSCIFNDDLHSEQRISVKEAGLTGNRGTFVITCLVENSDGVKTRTELYRIELAI